MRAWPLFWASLALALFGAALIFLGTGPEIEAGAGGLAAPETRMGGYSQAELESYIAGLSPEARATYLGPHRIADTLFPIGFFATLALGSFLALRRWGAGWAAMASLPAFVYLVFDMMENATFALLLRVGPGVDPGLAARADLATRAKFLFVDLALAVLALALLARLLAWAKARRG